MDWVNIVQFLALGAVTGLVAGLFGIGGGGLMVPVLMLLFTAADLGGEHRVHLALGTSMAAIVPTALASLRVHHRHGAVLWPVVARMAPGVLMGTFVATFVAASLPPEPLAVIFSVFMAYVSLQMIVNRKPVPSRQLPGTGGLVLAGSGIGGLSALVAIGGGSLTVPFLSWCNVRLPVAIGTSAAVGLPIAVAGALGYMLNGWGTDGLPAHTLGFVYWPAALSIVCFSALTAPLGARLAHRLPVTWLKRLFALMLMALSIEMLRTVF